MTTQGEMVVAKDFPLKGPSGTISKPWMSRADQSLSRTKPKMYERADSGVKYVPSSVDCETKAPCLYRHAATGQEVCVRGSRRVYKRRLTISNSQSSAFDAPVSISR